MKKESSFEIGNYKDLVIGELVIVDIDTKDPEKMFTGYWELEISTRGKYFRVMNSKGENQVFGMTNLRRPVGPLGIEVQHMLVKRRWLNFGAR